MDLNILQVIKQDGVKFTQHPGWEKIAWLNEFLPTIEDGSLVIYADCDSIFLTGDLTTALDDNYRDRNVRYIYISK